VHAASNSICSIVFHVPLTTISLPCHMFRRNCSIANRAVLQLNGALFGGDASSVSVDTAADPHAIKLRTQHGTLMAVNFIVVFPLGALMARQLRARWLNSLAAKAVLFYMHIAMQVCRGMRMQLASTFGGILWAAIVQLRCMLFSKVQCGVVGDCLPSNICMRVGKWPS
jgi:hypothetical protein